MCKVSLGDIVSFWNDLWEFGVLKWCFPHLYSFAKRKNISVFKFLANDIPQHVILPLSVVAAHQLQELVDLVNRNLPVDYSNDEWNYIWGSVVFTSKLAYTHLRGTLPASPLFKWMWRSCVQPKHKFFFWLLLRDRINTRNILKRKNMHLPSYHCVLCVQHEEETLHHLFVECPFSQACWIFLGVQWDLELSPLDMVMSSRDKFVPPFSEKSYCGSLVHMGSAQQHHLRW